jgi:hypothetical protein
MKRANSPAESKATSKLLSNIVTFAAVLEAATGLALMVGPSFVAHLLFGIDLTGVSIVVARVAGIGLFSLGLAYWPGKSAKHTTTYALLTYNTLVTLYLLFVGMRGEWVGPLLWPAVAVHAVLTVLLARSWGL